MSFIIATDTSANLPTAEVRKLGIVVIPLSYTCAGDTKTCLDTDSFKCAVYYESLKNGAIISTSQINPQLYIDYFEPHLKAGEDILFVGMSSGISGCFSSALMARNQLLSDYPDRKIRLVDTLGASLGEGLQVLRAQELKEQGKSIDEAADILKKERMNMYQFFTVDDLKHLQRGGRLSNAAAFVGVLLHIKPLLKGDENGRIVPSEKVRGRKASIIRIAEKYADLVREPEKQTVGISHCNCPEEAEQLAELIKASKAPKTVKIVEHEPVTGSYLGPGALALYFYGDDDIRLQ